MATPLNYYNWLQSKRTQASTACDASPFEESAHPREAKGGNRGGQFTKKPETIAR